MAEMTGVQPEYRTSLVCLLREASHTHSGRDNRYPTTTRGDNHTSVPEGTGEPHTCTSFSYIKTQHIIHCIAIYWKSLYLLMWVEVQLIYITMSCLFY